MLVLVCVVIGSVSYKVVFRVVGWIVMGWWEVMGCRRRFLIYVIDWSCR